MSEKKPPLSVPEALAAILANVAGPLPAEDVPLAACFGRTLARDILALRTQPNCALSAMDGYALRAADAAAGPLRVIGESSAGHGFAGACDPGEAVRIFTGAPMPQGADSVLVQEDAQRDGDFVVAQAAVKPGRNVRAAGIDFREGAAILRARRRLTAADVALAAAADHATLPVTRKPVIAVLSTGDELVAPGAARGRDQIVASNAFFVLGLVASAGGEPLDLGITRDRTDEIEAAVGRARAAGADVLTTIGGASVGDYDLVQGALSREGMALEFWKVNMKPGKPLIHGHIGPMRVLGLPGNPVSAAVCGELFLRPLIRALLGDPEASAERTEPALAGEDLPVGGGRREYIRAVLALDGEGRTVATPQPDQDSSLTSVLAASQALILREAKAPPARKGDRIEILRLA